MAEDYFFSSDNDKNFEREQAVKSEEEVWKDFDPEIAEINDIELAAIAESDDLGISQDPSMREMQDTFLDMSRNCLNPLTRYMKALNSGEDATEIYEISELIITPLISKVEQVGLIPHAEDLIFFRSLLLLALGESDQLAKSKLKEVVTEGFSDIRKRFSLYCRGDRKAVRNLVELYRTLRKTDSLDEHDVRRLFGIGIPSLSWLRKTRTSELCSLSGVADFKIRKIKEIASHGTSAMRFAAAELIREPKAPSFPKVEEQEESSIPDMEAQAILERKIF